MVYSRTSWRSRRKESSSGACHTWKMSLYKNTFILWELLCWWLLSSCGRMTTSYVRIILFIIYVSTFSGSICRISESGTPSSLTLSSQLLSFLIMIVSIAPQITYTLFILHTSPKKYFPLFVKFFIQNPHKFHSTSDGIEYQLSPPEGDFYEWIIARNAKIW